MDILAAYREVGSYRGAAEICGTTHKTVRRVVQRHNAGGAAAQRKDRGHNYDEVRVLVAERVRASQGRISAKRLLPSARAAGYAGSARNFRRLVAKVKAAWRAGHHRGRRPAVWTPGEALVIDWGAEGGLHVFCAVLAWSRFRFVRFAADERGATTLSSATRRPEKRRSSGSSDDVGRRSRPEALRHPATLRSARVGAARCPQRMVGRAVPCT